MVGPSHGRGRPTMTNVYRMHGAKLAIETTTQLGIMLLAVGPRVHAYPRGRLQRYPGLRAMVVRYRPEIMQLLDGRVE